MTAWWIELGSLVGEYRRLSRFLLEENEEAIAVRGDSLAISGNSLAIPGKNICAQMQLLEATTGAFEHHS